MSEWNKDSVRHWDGSHPCDILVTGLASFCLCPENLSEVELRDDGLVCLPEETSERAVDQKSGTSKEINATEMKSPVLHGN